MNLRGSGAGKALAGVCAIVAIGSGIGLEQSFEARLELNSINAGECGRVLDDTGTYNQSKKGQTCLEKDDNLAASEALFGVLLLSSAAAGVTLVKRPNESA